MNEKGIKGYKVFRPDWTCQPDKDKEPFQYEVGGVYEDELEPIICKQGFHFCTKLIDCFNYYKFTPENKVAEIIALGDIDTNGIKTCTNKIKIIRELSWFEVLEMVNVGKYCTGLNNTGDFNTGNLNGGNCNSGSYNNGHMNSGNTNEGNRNSGDQNCGSSNAGIIIVVIIIAVIGIVVILTVAIVIKETIIAEILMADNIIVDVIIMEILIVVIGIHVMALQDVLIL